MKTHNECAGFKVGDIVHYPMLKGLWIIVAIEGPDDSERINAFRVQSQREDGEVLLIPTVVACFEGRVVKRGDVVIRPRFMDPVAQ